MNCLKIQHELWEFNQGSLSEEISLEISRHLEACRECTSFLESLKQVGLELNHYGELNPSPYFDQKLNARLDEAGRESSWSRLTAFVFRQRYALSFALLLVTTVGVWVGFRHQQAAKLNSLEDVLRVQENYLGSAAPSRIEESVSPPTPSGHLPRSAHL